MKSRQFIKIAGTASLAMTLMLTTSSFSTIPAHAAASSASQSKTTWSVLDVKHKPEERSLGCMPLRRARERTAREHRRAVPTRKSKPSPIAARLR